MLHEAGYDIIPLYSAKKGMDTSISANLLPLDCSYYIENIMPDSLGDGQVRYGTSLFYPEPDIVMGAFPFQNAEGSKQHVVYFNGFQNFATFSNLVILDSTTIKLTSVNFALFKPDTLLRLQYTSVTGGSPTLTFRILSVVNTSGNNITIIVEENSFPDNLNNFFIQQVTSEIDFLDTNSISIAVPSDFNSSLYYSIDQIVHLIINDVQYDLTIATIVNSPSLVTFTFDESTIPFFVQPGDTVTLSYQSLTPHITTISNSYGYIKIYDFNAQGFLGGGNQTISNLSVACVPRGEFFADVMWICNGVDPIMTWNGTDLLVYTEAVKENANTFGHVDATHFTFVAGVGFDITKYQGGAKVQLNVLGVGSVTTVVLAVTNVAGTITIHTTDNIPAFTGANRVEVFYFDKPPTFSYMKGYNDRLWCLGEGAVSLDYRIPDQSLRFYYCYTPFTNGSPFRFFNETLKVVPSEDISAKHGISDNLEAIVGINGHLAFMGRQATQIWTGYDPLAQNSPNSFTWSSTLPVGVVHGDLVVELANDAYFFSATGFLSFSTLNIARQFAASTTNNMDKVGKEYFNTLNSDFDYRACKSFKYKNGGFCGFKIGNNNVIVAKDHTRLFWWGIFSGDFALSSTYITSLDDSLYLFINNKTLNGNDNNCLVYADGSADNGAYSYGDNNGNDYINFSETKYVNNLKYRFANKRIEVQASYSSNVIINSENQIDLYIRGDLRDSFTLQQAYDLPLGGDVLGTINLANGENVDPNNPNNPIANPIGLRLDAQSHTLKERIKFISSNFSVTLAGKIKNGPFSLNRIRLMGIMER